MMRTPQKVIEATLEPGILGETPAASAVVALDIIEQLNKEGYAIVVRQRTQVPFDPPCEDHPDAIGFRKDGKQK